VTYLTDCPFRIPRFNHHSADLSTVLDSAFYFPHSAIPHFTNNREYTTSKNYNAFCDLLCEDKRNRTTGQTAFTDIKVVACPTVGLNNLKAHTWCTQDMYKKA